MCLCALSMSGALSFPPLKYALMTLLRALKVITLLLGSHEHVFTLHPVVHFTSLVRLPSLNLRSSVQGSCGKVLCVPGECVPLSIQSALVRPSVKRPALLSPKHPKCASAAFSEGTCTLHEGAAVCVCVCVCVCAHPKCGLQLRILHFWMVAYRAM